MKLLTLMSMSILTLIGAFSMSIGYTQTINISKTAQNTGIPSLQKAGRVTQLFVDGKPFLMLGGELLNSTSSSLDSMAKIWPHMNALNANTVLVPVSWEQVEPKEGEFDFTIVDGLIQGARKHNLHLVFLWLASWKNGMSSYQPLWVKKDYRRFSLARNSDGTPRSVLSTLSANNWSADAAGFAGLMRHIREVDGEHHTVVMVQVENEVGILGDSRDRSKAANDAYAGSVPRALMDHLIQNDTDLVPEFRALWTAAGHKSTGTWEEIFGPGPQTDEIFMAWSYACYVDKVAAAGKAEYPIPMYTNAWLNDPMDSKPGSYPSGCPESHLIDVWQAGASNLDLLAPDLYAGNFQERCDLYTRRGNTLFIPETNSNDVTARDIFLAIGHYHAIGVSPFAIDFTPIDGPISKSYAILAEVAPVFLDCQGKGVSTGFTLDAEHPSTTYTMGDYEVQISLDEVFGRTAELGYGVVMQTGPDEFLGAGSGFRVQFRPLTVGPAYAGIGEVHEGAFVEGKWVQGRWLNGDETDQGNSWRFSSWRPGISMCLVYRYE